MGPTHAIGVYQPKNKQLQTHGDSRYTTPCRGRRMQLPPILGNLGRMPTATTALSSLSRRRTSARRTWPLACTRLFAPAFSRRCGEQARRRLLALGKNCDRCPSGSWRAIFVRLSAGSVSACVLVHGWKHTNYSVSMRNETVGQQSDAPLPVIRSLKHSQSGGTEHALIQVLGNHCSVLRIGKVPTKSEYCANSGVYWQTTISDRGEINNRNRPPQNACRTSQHI